MTKKIASKKVAKKATKKLTLSQKIAKNKRDTERAKQSIARNGQKLFKEGVKEIFKKHKGLNAFSWTQYTPHWNDGDACEFGANIESLAINEECEGDYEDIEGLWSLEHVRDLLSKREKEEKRILLEIEEIKTTKKDEWKISQLENDLESLKSRDPKEVEEKWLIKSDITELLEGIDESALQDMFGEGKVIVNRDGSTVEDYEHD